MATTTTVLVCQQLHSDATSATLPFTVGVGVPERPSFRATNHLPPTGSDSTHVTTLQLHLQARDSSCGRRYG